jgi:hypothetical protein
VPQEAIRSSADDCLVLAHAHVTGEGFTEQTPAVAAEECTGDDGPDADCEHRHAVRGTELQWSS